MSHTEFGIVMQEFVANLHDAHTRLTHWRELMINGMQVRVSTLGFFTKRVIRDGKSEYTVGRVFPRFFSGEVPPVIEGDIIVAIDGRDPETIIRKDFAINGTGQADSDASVLAWDLSIRANLDYPQRPTGRAVLTIRRGDSTRDVQLEWVDANVRDIARRLREEDEARDNGKSQRQSRLNTLQAMVTGVDQDGRWLVHTQSEPSLIPLLRGQATRAPYIGMHYAAQSKVMMNKALDIGSEERATPAGSAEIIVEKIPSAFSKPQRAWPLHTALRTSCGVGSSARRKSIHWGGLGVTFCGVRITPKPSASWLGWALQTWCLTCATTAVAFWIFPTSYCAPSPRVAYPPNWRPCV